MVQIDGIPRTKTCKPAAATEDPPRIFPVEEPAQAHLAASAQTTAGRNGFRPKAQGEESIDDIVEFDFEDEGPRPRKTARRRRDWRDCRIRFARVKD